MRPVGYIVDLYLYIVCSHYLNNIAEFLRVILGTIKYAAVNEYW